MAPRSDHLIIYPLYEVLVAGLGQSGRLDAIAAAREDLERLRPADFERMWQLTHGYLNPADLEHLREGLQNAGASEQVRPLRASF